MTPARQQQVAAVLGAVAVAAGAFGAHGLKSVVTPEHLATWETAARYHLIHAVVLLVVAAAPERAHRWSYMLFLAGIAVFAGSLYLMVGLGALVGDTSPAAQPLRMLGAVTPVGGALLIAGWASLAWPQKASAERT